MIGFRKFQAEIVKLAERETEVSEELSKSLQTLKKAETQRGRKSANSHLTSSSGGRTPKEHLTRCSKITTSLKQTIPG